MCGLINTIDINAISRYFLSVISLLSLTTIGWSDSHRSSLPPVQPKVDLVGDWYPSVWGKADQRGAANRLTPQKVLEAVRLIRTGQVYQLGRLYEAGMPVYGTRHFSLRIPRTSGPLGENQLTWHEEIVSGELGQVGTQFDGLGHIGVQVGVNGDKNEMRWYNGFSAQEMGSAYGLLKLGIEKLHPIIARGVLIDIQAIKGRDMTAGEVITLADVKAALKRQGMSDFKLMEGDAVAFRTGWESHWEDAATYNAGCPGIGMEVARWLADGNVGVTAGDTWPVDAVPNPDPDCVFCVHTFLQTRHGIVNHENLRLSELAEAGVYQFAYFFAPAPIRGGTGSMGTPVAMW